MKIEKVEVRVVGPMVERHTWIHDLPEQYMTNTIVSIQTDEGITGIGSTTSFSENGFDRSISETIRRMIPFLIGADPLQRETLWYKIRPRIFPIQLNAISAVDVALWDLLGKYVNLPLYQLLGGARNKILSYASTPLLPSVPAYLDFVEDLKQQGYRAIKFHAWGIPEKDLELVRAVREQNPGGEIAFMFDSENNYDRQSALEVAVELERLEFTWFEAPFSDYDIAGYRELTARVNIPIVPAGNWIVELPLIAEALSTRAWGRVRFDVGTCGGLTQARKILALAEAANLYTEVQSWAYTLTQAADLHLSLAYPMCTYFEQPVPYDSYEYGMKDMIRTQPDGFVYAPKGPGLGVEIDWDKMEAATVHLVSSDERALD